MSLRVHLLLWFMLFAAFATLIGIVFTLLFLNKKNETYTCLDNLNHSQLELSRLKSYQNNFFTYDTKSPAFYVEETSSNLKAYKKQAHSFLNTIQNNQPVTDEGISLDTLVKHFVTMDSLFMLTVHLSYEMGYKDFGIIGAMRKHIHILENFPQLDQAKILSLRRHEKDYIIRNEDIYIDNFHRLYNRFLPEVIDNPNLDARQKAIVIPALEQYNQRFKEFTALHKQIGDRESGYIYQISEANKLMNAELVNLKSEASIVQTNEEHQIAIIYTAMLILLILFAAIAGWYVSGRLILPMKKVISRIAGIQEKDSYENPLPPFYSKYKELNLLCSSLNNLLNKLSEQKNKRNKISVKMMNRLNLHKDILNSLGIIVFTCDDEGKLSYANHQFHLFTGYTDEDVEDGLYIDEILTEVAGNADGKIGPSSYTLICNDNTYKDVLIDINNNSALNHRTGIIFEKSKLKISPGNITGQNIQLPLLPERN